MPLFTPDFSSVDASIPIYEKGRYRVKVTKRTGVIRTSKADKDGNTHTSAGVRYNLEMVGQFDREGNLTDDLAGKVVSPFTGYVHTDKAWGMCKQFLMAACGFKSNEEAKANAELFQVNDWTLDGEPGEAPENMILGDGWNLPLDRLVDVTLSKRTQKNDDTGDIYENQDYGSWAPVE